VLKEKGVAPDEGVDALLLFFFSHFTRSRPVPGPTQEITMEDERIGSWRLARATPDLPLHGVVREYWEVQGVLAGFRETLLPNGAVELMFNLGAPHCVLSDQAPGEWTGSWCSGLQEKALVIETLQGTHLLSIRLHPLGATALLGFPAPRTVNRVVDLAPILGEDAEGLRQRALAVSSPTERFALLEEFLQSRAWALDSIPAFIRSAAARIEATHGCAPISELHEALEISRKHLSVTFARYMGMTAKAYAQIQRFVWTLERVQQSSEVDWSRLALDAGYSDQSHLVRDFQRVGAATPTTYLRSRTPDGTAILHD
jgi:AraC-like DNA-binding protein